MREVASKAARKSYRSRMRATRTDAKIEEANHMTNITNPTVKKILVASSMEYEAPAQNENYK